MKVLLGGTRVARFSRTSPFWTAFIWAKNDKMLARRCSGSMGRRVSDPSLWPWKNLADMWCTNINMAGWMVMAVDCHQGIFLGGLTLQPFQLVAGSATLDAMICDRWLLKTYLARTNFGPFIPLASCTAPWPEKPGRTELCSWLQRKPSRREPLQRLRVWSMTPSTPWSSMAAKQKTFSFCIDWKVWDE